ncbi:tetratricopeptide repeat protein [Methylobacterium nigriterrae]|uniref:tetratricopeptide repeat protein n=1 Tax=Methylobacterium nigriterrae TaxID=3127512 RepID=UPI0030135119
MDLSGVNLRDVIAQTINIHDIHVGATADEIIEKIVGVLETSEVLVGFELAGLQRRMIIRLARDLKPDVSDFDQAVTELERAVDIALDLIARGERGTNEGAFVNAVLTQVAERVRNDDLDGGARTVDEALAKLEAEEVERQAQYRQSQIALLEEGVKVDTLRRDAVAVAKRIEQIVAASHQTGRPAWHPEFGARYDACWADGAEKGINFSLLVAIELARRMAATARDADERGLALNRLGSALATLGGWESSTTRLEEAVAVFRAALEEQTRKRSPLSWATIQTNLGGALQVLGERESDPARLKEAVAAFRAALEEQTRKRSPLEWARTQHNLGGALVRQGERENDTAHLEEAVAAFRAALEERTREQVPLDWAGTQMNLGAALAALGGRESSTAHLEEAVAAFRAALEERTRERVPLNWAGTQMNLGAALQMLGERENDTARLEEAVAAYRAALEEETRERVPLNWAGTQMNLGSALAALGERESRTDRLEEAVAAFDACLMVAALVWLPERVGKVRADRDKAQAEIKRRVSAQDG